MTILDIFRRPPEPEPDWSMPVISQWRDLDSAPWDALLFVCTAPNVVSIATRRMAEDWQRNGWRVLWCPMPPLPTSFDDDDCRGDAADAAGPGWGLRPGPAA